MKNAILPFFLMSIFTYNASAKDFQVTIALNMKDCINCVRSFYQLSELKEEFDIFIVMQKRYQSDSAYLAKEYQLDKVDPTFIWSDSLYNDYSISGMSTINLESKYKMHRLQYGMNGGNSELFNYLKVVNKGRDTLFPNEDYFLNGVDKLRFNHNKLVLLSRFKKEISVYDLISQKKLYSVNLSGDEILSEVFTYNGKPISEYKNQKEAMIKAGVPDRLFIWNLAFHDDTVLAFLDAKYFDYSDPDTLLTSNFAILKILNGKVVSINKSTYEIDYEDRAYRFPRFYPTIYNDTIIDYIAEDIPTANRKYMAKFVMDNGVYKPVDFLDIRVPKLYDTSTGCFFPIYYKEYFILPMYGTIYSLNPKNKDIVLPFFNNDNVTRFNYCTVVNNYVYSFRYNDEWVWIQLDEYLDGVAGKRRFTRKFIKYNRNDNDTVVSKFTFVNNNDMLIMDFDPINPDFILAEAGEGMLIRKRIFD